MSRYRMTDAALLLNFESHRYGRLLLLCVHDLFCFNPTFLPVIYPKLKTLLALGF